MKIRYFLDFQCGTKIKQKGGRLFYLHLNLWQTPGYMMSLGIMQRLQLTFAEGKNWAFAWLLDCVQCVRIRRSWKRHGVNNTDIHIFILKCIYVIICGGSSNWCRHLIIEWQIIPLPSWHSLNVSSESNLCVKGLLYHQV